MPLSLLHDYRHAHKLSTPSAYARPISRLLLSSGVGLRSPTAIAARRAALGASTSSSSNSSASVSSSERSNNNSNSNSNGNGNINGRRNADEPADNNNDESSSNKNKNKNKNKKDTLHKQINSQNRISKDHLALAVRKHFNAAGLVEQEAIARFLYKVREEGKGREFRLRFQP
jgi:hypothetical protein